MASAWCSDFSSEEPPIVVNPTVVSVQRLGTPKRIEITFDMPIDPLSDALPTQFTVPEYTGLQQPTAYYDLTGNVLQLLCNWPAFQPVPAHLNYVAAPGGIYGAVGGTLQAFTGFEW